MLKAPLTLIRGLGTVGLIGSIGFLCWDQLAPEKPQIGPQRKELADQLIPQIVEDIRQSPQRVRPVALLHLANDASDYFTDRLRAVIEERGVLDLTSRTLSERTRNTLSIRQPETGTKAAAVEQASQLGTPGVLFGRIHVFESWDGGAKIDVEVTLVDTSSRQILFDKRYAESTGTEPLPEAIPRTDSSDLTLQRVIAWALLVLLLPVFSIGFIRSMVSKNSNSTNAFVLGVYTLADGLLAWLMVGASVTSMWTGLILLAAIAIALAYNVRIMTFALKLET